MEFKVTKLENNLWVVSDGEKYSEECNYEEMLGLFVSLTMPKEPRPCLQWMKTKEQHDLLEHIREQDFKSINNDLLFEDEPVEQIKEGDTFEGNGYNGIFMINKDALELHKAIPIELYDINNEVDYSTKWFFQKSAIEKRELCKKYNVAKINSVSVAMIYKNEFKQ